MKKLKLISILILLCIAISNIACGDCDEDVTPAQQKSTPTSIHKDTLDVN